VGGWCTEWASRRAGYREQESSSKCFESKERCESLPGGKYRDSLLFIVILLGGTFHLYLLSLFYSSSTASQNKMEENKRDRDYGQWRTGGVYTGGGGVCSPHRIYTLVYPTHRKKMLKTKRVLKRGSMTCLPPPHTLQQQQPPTPWFYFLESSARIVSVKVFRSLLILFAGASGRKKKKRQTDRQTGQNYTRAQK
jgi:hypothetical protein